MVCNICHKNEAREGFKSCAKCAESKKERQKADRLAYKKAGICTRCRTEYALFGNTRCEKCNQILADYYMANKYEIAQKSRNRKLARIAEGICTRCGRKVESSRYQTCEICRAKSRARKKKNGLSRNEYPNYGMCYLCGSKVEEGFRVCEKCHQNCIDNLAKRDKPQNNIWNNDNQLVFRKKVNA